MVTLRSQEVAQCCARWHGVTIACRLGKGCRPGAPAASHLPSETGRLGTLLAATQLQEGGGTVHLAGAAALHALPVLQLVVLRREKQMVMYMGGGGACGGKEWVAGTRPQAEVPRSRASGSHISCLAQMHPLPHTNAPTWRSTSSTPSLSCATTRSRSSGAPTVPWSLHAFMNCGRGIEGGWPEQNIKKHACKHVFM